MNNYCRLGHLKGDAVNVQSSNLDDTYLRAIDAVSREVDNLCNRRFFSEIRTIYVDGNGKRTLRLRPIPGESDLLSVSSLTVDDDDDGTYDVTLVEGTDYRLLPVNETNKTAIELLTRGTQLSTWPTGQSSVKIVGTWGYSAETEAVGVTGTVADGTSTTITAASVVDEKVYPGDTLVIESEQCYVSDVAGTVITVTRGINGTTAASHSAKAMSVRRYPRDIEEAVKIRVTSSRWDVNQGSPMGEVGRQFDPIYPKYRGLLNPFRLLVVA